VALLTQKIHQGPERWPHLAAARIIKKEPCRRSWRPLVENGHKSARGWPPARAMNSPGNLPGVSLLGELDLIETSELTVRR
jgi:hypothetical protein